MPPDNAETTRARQRVSNACRACRQRKVKCTGSNPCPSCNVRGQECIYDEAERKVVVLERHLRALQGRASARGSRQRRAVGGEDDREEEQSTIGALASSQTPSVRASEEPAQASAVPCPEAMLEASDCGSFSPWNYITAASRVLDPTSNDSGDYRSFDFDNQSAAAFLPDLNPMQSLPSLDIILHLVRVADFHLNCILKFFHVEDVLHRLTATTEVGPVSPTWKSQLLAIIACGKLHTEKGATKQGPPGFREFLSADRCMPSMMNMAVDVVGSVETLCLLGAYAQAAHLHDMSYLYIGQACRLVETSAFRNACKACSDIASRRRSHLERLRQTVQFLDLRASAIRGGSSQTPEALQENPGSKISSHLRIGLEIAVIISSNSILTEFLGHAQTSNRLNEDGMISSLESLQLIGKRIHELQKIHGQTTGREVGMLQLWFCHGIINVTRPALLCRAAQTRTRRSAAAESRVPHQTGTVLAEICAKYSFLALKMVSKLQQDSRLESFSFDVLDITTISAISVLLHGNLEESADATHALDAADAVLADMERRGNIPAEGIRNAIRSRRRHLPHSATVERTNDPTRWNWDGINLDERMLGISDLQPLDSPRATAQETELSGTLAVDEMPSLLGDDLTAAGPFLEDVGDGGGEHFAFDMEDLQWLDAV
ncbi:hypothetical protein B0T11DRAFT_282521 [Plectosphaerella cucumerina]|uniref:Zn(2)-C6 fungal-type domain-containing protein n=1 Tax=Plectosphaerella cucumerina TaxID=40658 RepID=A0A8K0TNG8_9PEZI|nr:hypothetical protein B0T11DRAFT_282521 [Plectosphaerella cucumerina]